MLSPSSQEIYLFSGDKLVTVKVTKEQVYKYEDLEKWISKEGSFSFKILFDLIGWREDIVDKFKREITEHSEMKEGNEETIRQVLKFREGKNHA